MTIATRTQRNQTWGKPIPLRDIEHAIEITLGVPEVQGAQVLLQQGDRDRVFTFDRGEWVAGDVL